MWSNVAVLEQCCSLFGLTFHYTCLVGLPRVLADVCSHYRTSSGRNVALTIHVLMVPRLAMPGSVTPNPICLLFMSCAQGHTGTIFFSVALRPNAGHGLLILEVSRSHTTTHHSR